jgi:hypothetical protein
MSKDSFCCRQCGAAMDNRRWYAGYTSCMSCGDAQASLARKSWTVAPMHKSNYVLITNHDDLTGINNKGGLVK